MSKSEDILKKNFGASIGENYVYVTDKKKLIDSMNEMAAFPTPDAVGITDEEIEKEANEHYYYHELTEKLAFIKGMERLRSLLSSKQTEAERLLRELEYTGHPYNNLVDTSAMSDSEYQKKVEKHQQRREAAKQAARQWCIDNPEKV